MAKVEDKKAAAATVGAASAVAVEEPTKAEVFAAEHIEKQGVPESIANLQEYSACEGKAEGDVISVGWMAGVNKVTVVTADKDGAQTVEEFPATEDQYKELEKCFHPEEGEKFNQADANELYQELKEANTPK